MESMKSSFDPSMNLTDVQAFIKDMCYNESSSSRMMFVDVDARRRTPSYARQRVFLDVHVVGLLCLVGFIGNALTIAVLRRDWQDGSNATNWLLRTLAGVDTFYLITCLFVQTFNTVHDFTDWFPDALRPYFPYAERYMWPVASIGQTVTIWTVLLVTVDRYMAVCRPFDTRMRTVDRATKLFVGVVVAAIVYNIPRFFEREVKVKENGCLKQPHAEVVNTALRDNEIYFVVYKLACYLVFRSVGPLVTLLVLNVFLIKALHAARRRHQQMSSATTTSRRTRHRENVTLILIVVVSVFIICQLPDLALRIAAIVDGESARTAPGSERFLAEVSKKDLMRFINSITNVLLTLNSAVNFLIYCLLGKKFRRIFVDMFCGWLPCCRNRRRPSTIDHSDIRLVTGRTNVPSRAVPEGPRRQASTRRWSLTLKSQPLLAVPGGSQDANSRSAPSLLLVMSPESRPSSPCRIDVHV